MVINTCWNFVIWSNIFVTPNAYSMVVVDDENTVIELFELTCCGGMEKLIYSMHKT